MRPRLHLLGLTAALACSLLTHTVVANQQPSANQQAREQLAGRLVRQATMAAAQRQQTLESMQIAQILLAEAVQLDPRNERAWRLMLELAETLEDSKWQDASIEALTSLDPSDELVRLKRQTRIIERQQTVEARIDEYRRLLSQQNRSRLGAAVASRLALDLALLERRVGNSRGFANWLAEAVAIDPSHKAAAALAAGYFRANVHDPIGEAELLLTLLMADPTSGTAQVALGSHMLQYGAYNAASRLLGLAARTNESAFVRSGPDLIADLAIAQWGSGDSETALRTVRDYQRQADAIHRRELQQQRPEMTSLERARETAVIDPTLAVVRTAIHRRLGSDLAGPTLASAIQAYEALIQIANAMETPDPHAVARLKLELAWVMLWLDGNDTQRVRELLAEAAAIDALSDVAEARFNGWLALREGDYDAALQYFDPYKDHDAAAELGRATVLLSEGQIRDGARALVNLARTQSGNIIGVWSSDMLWEVLGQRASIGNEVAAELERLVETIPNVVDRFPQDPSTAFSIRVTPAKPTFQPNEPVIVNLEITNHAPFPIAMDRDGPIRPQVVLNVTAEMVRAGRSEAIPPIVVDIQRRLRLMPRERLVIPVDLRSTMAGNTLDRAPIPGAILRVKATLNFIVLPNGAIIPGAMGAERETPPFRVDGFRVTQQWLEQTMAQLVDQRGDVDLASLAALCHIAAGGVVDQSEQVRRLFIEARTVLAETYARLDSETQAWMLSVLPQTDAFNPILDMARRSQNRTVQLSYLLHQIRSTSDPMLDAAERSGDKGVATMAAFVRPRLQRADDELFDLPVNR